MKIQFVLTIITAAFECWIYSGITFGWPSLQYVLLRTGYFAEQCPELVNSTSLNTTKMQSCDTRDSTFNLIFTLAGSILPISTLPFGFILDRFGTWVARVVTVSCVALGYICLSVSQPETSWLIFPAIILMAISGISILVVNLQTANLAGRAKPIIVTLMSGLFDSSSIVFLTVKLIFDAGLDYKVFVYVMTAGSFLMFVSTFVLMPRTHIPSPPPKDIKYGIYEWHKAPHKDVDVVFTDITQDVKVRQDDHEGVEYISLKESLKNITFWTHSFSFSIYHLRLVFYFGVLVDWLEINVPGDELSSYLNVFTILTVCGMLVAPLNGLLIQTVIKFARKQTTNKTATMYGIFASNSSILFLAFLLSISVVIKGAEYASFVFLVIYRGFLYGGANAYIALVFPVEHFGTLTGIANSIAGVFALLQYGLFQIAVNYDPNFTVINYAFIGAVCLCIIHPLVLWKFK